MAERAAIAERLAREVMGWHTTETVWWREASGEWVAVDGDLIAHTAPTQPWPWPPNSYSSYKLWEPHYNRLQALLVLGKMVEKGWAYLYRSPPPGWCGSTEEGLFLCALWRQHHYVKARGVALGLAICAAVVKALDARKEKP